jgi:RNA polymerase sigma factor (sigma-70 family)
MDEPTDEELVAHYRLSPASASAQASINALFHRHHSKVAAWCYKFTNDINAAADLAQEVFLKAFQRLDSFRGESKFTTWLYTIARNHCTDQLRSTRGGRAELPEALPDIRIEDFSETVEKEQAGELIRRLMKETLDDMESQVMTLHYVEEMPLDTITRVLGLTNRSGAKAYVVSARRKLAKAFAAWKTEGIFGVKNVR